MNLRHLISDERGYTLVELLVVVLIIAALVAIAVPSYLGYRGRAQDRVAQSDLRAALPAAEAYRTDNGDFAGMDLPALRANDSGLAPDIDHVAVTGGGAGYCIGATADTASWSIGGPEIVWYHSDTCASGTEATP